MSFSDTTLAAETCEELFTPRAPHIALSLSGIEIISNGSGSHHQLRCFLRMPLLSKRCGGHFRPIVSCRTRHCFHLIANLAMLHVIRDAAVAWRPLLSITFGCRKLNQRLDLMCHATSVAGGVYMYANQRGCDGGRLYYDGSACVICNGQLLAQARRASARTAACYAPLKCWQIP